MGVVAPKATGKEKFLKVLKEGISGIEFIPELKELNFGCHVGGIPDITDSKYNELLAYYGLTGESQSIQFGCMAGLEAWEDAALKIPDYDSTEVDYETGVIAGTGIGSMDLTGKVLIPNIDSGSVNKLRSTIVEQLMISGTSSQLSGMLALGNLCMSNSNACSTGTDAIIMGYERIKSGGAYKMLVGGTDGYSPYYWSFFDNMRLLTRDFNDQPQSASRPMSASSSGFVPSAGAGMLLLENLESANERGAKIYAEIIGASYNSGGQRNGGSMTAPSSEGVEQCIAAAISNSGIKPQEIDIIAGHLTSTKADAMEVKNWISVLRLNRSSFPFINSLKSILGHSLGASGAIETIAAVLEITENFVHPSINCADLNPDISTLLDERTIPHTLIENVEINCIAKASFGFGDVNSCLIIKAIES